MAVDADSRMRARGWKDDKGISRAWRKRTSAVKVEKAQDWYSVRRFPPRFDRERGCHPSTSGMQIDDLIEGASGPALGARRPQTDLLAHKEQALRFLSRASRIAVRKAITLKDDDKLRNA